MPSRGKARCRRTSSSAGNGSSWSRASAGCEPEERELILARAKIGELMMRLELAEDLVEKRGFTDEWKRRRG